MIRLRFRRSVSITLVLALAVIPTAIAQDPLVGRRPQDPLAGPRPLASSAPDSASRSYKIYSLDDFGSDPGFCEWIAQTIPYVIATGTWRGDGPGEIRSYAPKNILVVYHTPAVQAQVDAFLKDVKKSLPDPTKASTAAPRRPASFREVVPIVYDAPNVPKKGQSKRAPEANLSYPVPAQPKAPKHLFHFIIRYEGEGIVDDNIVKAMKDYYRAEKQANQQGRAGSYASGSSERPPGPVSITPPASEKEDKKEDKSIEKDKQNPCPPVSR